MASIFSFDKRQNVSAFKATLTHGGAEQWDVVFLPYISFQKHDWLNAKVDCTYQSLVFDFGETHALGR